MKVAEKASDRHHFCSQISLPQGRNLSTGSLRSASKKGSQNITGFSPELTLNGLKNFQTTGTILFVILWYASAPKYIIQISPEEVEWPQWSSKSLNPKKQQKHVPQLTSEMKPSSLIQPCASGECPWPENREEVPTPTKNFKPPERCFVSP